MNWDEEAKGDDAWAPTEVLAVDLIRGMRWDAMSPAQRTLARRLESMGLIQPRTLGSLVVALTPGQMQPLSRSFTFEYLLREADQYTYQVNGGECEESVRLPALGLLTGFLLNVFNYH